MNLEERIEQSPHLTRERYAKLPGWAKDEIAHLISLYHSVADELAAERSTTSGPLIINPYSEETRRGIVARRMPEDTHIRWELDEDGRETFDLRLRWGSLEIMHQGHSLRRHMAITPQSSNVVYLRSFEEEA